MSKGQTWGMPSSRAACLFFILTYLLIVDDLTRTTKYVLLGCVILGCTMKYVLKEHSMIQLIVGALIGVLIAKTMTGIEPATT